MSAEYAKSVKNVIVMNESLLNDCKNTGIMKNKLNFTFRVMKNGKTIDRCQTHSKRRFYNRIRSIKWKDGVEKVYLRVSYGKALDNFGKVTNFYNSGEYENRKDLFFALSAFTEDI